MKITINPRLHLALISMHAGGYRINGGVGFSIKNPNAVCSFTSSAKFGFFDDRPFPFAKEEVTSLANTINLEQKRLNAPQNVHAHIQGAMGTHLGFGSGTAIRLACLEALYKINGLPIDAETIIQTSGRGGTSGIGINAYFNGGMLFDLGRKSQESHKPSSQFDQVNDRPLLLKRISFPNWKIGICVPKLLPIKSRADEIAFFNRIAPIEPQESYEALYHALFGAFAAVQEGDKQTFCEAIKKLQDSKWKKAERDQYGLPLRELEVALYRNGAQAVAMSSFGPSLVFFGENIASTIENTQEHFAEYDYLETTANNTGRVICSS